MCLLVVAWQSHPRIRLLAAGNRDEFHHRPTAAAAFWPDRPEILAGRDLEAGGTWMGSSRHGRFAAITNVRPSPGEVTDRTGLRSRGELPVRFLDSGLRADEFCRQLESAQDEYAGFNLLVADTERLCYFSNRDSDSPRLLQPGVHALSNQRLETPWPKLLRLKRRFETALQEGRVDAERLLTLLYDQEMAGPGELPDTGLDPSLERRLSAAFVLGKDYGTRCSTLTWLYRSGYGRYLERRFGPNGQATGDSRFRFTLESMEWLAQHE